MRIYHTQPCLNILSSLLPFVSAFKYLRCFLPFSHTMSPALLASGASTLGGVDSFVSCLKQILSTIEKSSLEPPLGEPDFDPELLCQIIKPTTQPVDELYKSSLEIACKTILYELAVCARCGPIKSKFLTKFRQKTPLLVMKP